jgi:uncharacterized protein YodC (DUF2158 family)
VLRALSSDEEADEVLRELRRLEILDTGGVALASAAARNYRVMRSRGRTVQKTIDCLIATFCIDGVTNCFIATVTSTRSRSIWACRWFTHHPERRSRFRRDGLSAAGPGAESGAATGQPDCHPQ